MATAAYYIEKARQCRRLSETVGHDRTVRILTVMAEEFEDAARAAEAPADDEVRHGRSLFAGSITGLVTKFS